MKEITRKIEQYRKVLGKAPHRYIQAADKTYQWNAGRSDMPIAKIAADSYVVAPVVNSYVMWIIDNAIKTGINRLYFLARDAYLMYECARVYVERYGINIECRYLSCSRYSIRIPMYHKKMNQALDYITLGGINLTWRKILSRAGIAKEKMQAILSDVHPEVTLETRIMPSELIAVREQLSKSKAFMKELYDNSEKAYKAFDIYMKNEGIADGVSKAVVDTGWVGTMQKELNNYVVSVSESAAPIQGFYWGLYELPDGSDEKMYHTYYFAPYKDIRRKAYFNNNLMEGILTAPHGMTIGYELRNDKAYPVYENIADCRCELVRDTLSTVKKYWNELLKESDIDRLEKISVKTIQQLIRMFMVTPTREEASFFGQLYFGDDVREYGNEYMAAKLTEDELRKSHCINKVLDVIRGRNGLSCISAWYQGSAVLYSKRPLRHIRSYTRYQYLLNYQKNRRRNK